VSCPSLSSTSGPRRHQRVYISFLPHSGLLPLRPLPTVAWPAGRAAGGHRTATPQPNAMNPSAAGIQMRSVYSGSIALTSSVSSRYPGQGTGSALCGLSVPGVTFKIPWRNVRRSPDTLQKNYACFIHQQKLTVMLPIIFLHAPTGPTWDPLGNKQLPQNLR